MQDGRLIDCFVNTVFLYDDKILRTFNYKEGSKTVSLDGIESSDLAGNGAPGKGLLKPKGP